MRAGALVYVEIGTLIPLSGSSYYFLREVYGDLVGFLYMFTWVVFLLPGGLFSLLLIQSRVCLYVIVTSLSSGIAIVGLTCSEYAIALFFNDDCGPAPETIRKTLAAAILS